MLVKGERPDRPGKAAMGGGPGGGGGVGTYYLPDRTHLGLAKDTPAGRAVEQRPSPCAKVVALPRCGGLHHRYVWGEAA